jgi:DNA-binding winged helix-turn-helix (wHTH) protein
VTPTCPNCGFDLKKCEPITIGRYSYSLSRGFAIKGRNIYIAPTCHEVLGVLMRMRGEVLTYNGIMERLGRDWRSPPDAVWAIMFQIRRAFRALKIPCPVEVVTGKGLRWIG